MTDADNKLYCCLDCDGIGEVPTVTANGLVDTPCANCKGAGLAPLPEGNVPIDGFKHVGTVTGRLSSNSPPNYDYKPQPCDYPFAQTPEQPFPAPPFRYGTMPSLDWKKGIGLSDRDRQAAERIQALIAEKAEKNKSFIKLLVECATVFVLTETGPWVIRRKWDYLGKPVWSYFMGFEAWSIDWYVDTLGEGWKQAQTYDNWDSLVAYMEKINQSGDRAEVWPLKWCKDEH